MPRSKRNNRRRKPRPQMKNERRYAVPQMQGAPAGVSQDLQQFTHFLPSGNREHLRMHACAAICQIDKIANGGGALRPASGAQISGQLNLTAPAWLASAGTKSEQDYVSPVFDLIGSAFVRYKVNKCVFHYEPQSSATTDERLVFAFAADPLHPVLWNATPPSQTDLLALADSIAFAPWRSWSMDVTEKLLDKTILYTYSDSATTVGEFNERFSDFGVISCVSDTVSGTTAFCGVLYMDLDVTLMEFCPIVNVSPAAAKRLLNHDLLEKRSNFKHSQPIAASSSSSTESTLISTRSSSDIDEKNLRASCNHENAITEKTNTGYSFRHCPDCDQILHKFH